MNAGVGVGAGLLALIVFVIFVSADESRSVIRIKNKTPDAQINGIASWEPKSPTESSIKSTGKIPAGGLATIEIPSEVGAQKISLSINRFRFSDVIEPISSLTIILPSKRCYAVNEVHKDTYTMNEENCSSS